MKRVIVIIGAVMLLSGCVPYGTPVAEPSSSATATATPSPTPTPTPTKPALADLILEPDGLGALRIGQLVPETSAELALVTWNPDHCEGYPADQAGGWDTAYPADPNGVFGPTPPFALDTRDRAQTTPIRAIQTFSPQLRTATGVRVGSEFTELTAAYPAGFSATTTGLYTRTYAIDGSAGRLLFEVYDGSADADGRTTVAIITSVPLATAPFTAIPGDAIVGGCA